MTYYPGKWKIVCDRCGGVYLNTEIREEWTGLMVCIRGCWEPKHPQLDITGVADDPTVPISRPDVVQASGTTTLNGAVSKYALTIIVTSASGISDEDPIGIELNSATSTDYDKPPMFWTYVNGTPAGTTVTLGTQMPDDADDGNTVYVPGTNNENWQSDLNPYD